MTEKSNVERRRELLRWFSFLPVALMAAVFAWYVVRLIVAVLFGLLGLGMANLGASLVAVAATHWAAGAALVYGGARTAPAHHLSIAYCLAALGFAITALLLIAAAFVANAWVAWGAFWIAVGAATVAWLVRAGKTDIIP